MNISEAAQALTERLAELIEEFTEANTIRVDDVLEALEFTHACVERFVSGDDIPSSKMH